MEKLLKKLNLLNDKKLLDLKEKIENKLKKYDKNLIVKHQKTYDNLISQLNHTERPYHLENYLQHNTYTHQNYNYVHLQARADALYKTINEYKVLNKALKQVNEEILQRKTLNKENQL